MPTKPTRLVAAVITSSAMRQAWQAHSTPRSCCG
jgi:hypothetical protein